MKNIIITGGAGFIGSHLADRLVSDGENVTVIDNLATGRLAFISHLRSRRNFTFIKADLQDHRKYSPALKGADAVYHLAANPDVRAAFADTRVEIDQGVLSTYHILEACRKADVPSFVFSSSSAVYGEPKATPVPEGYGPLLPISLYGASKLAGEGFVSSYCGTFGMSGLIYRFANIVGSRATHGVICDFAAKLRRNPETLEVLGDGRQAKSYLLAEECVDAMVFGARKRLESNSGKAEVYNVSNRDRISVADLAREVISVSRTGAKAVFTGGKRGWPGDVPKVLLDSSKLARLGWKAKHDSRTAVKIAARHAWEETGA